MKGLKRGISVVLASALILTALPVNGISRVNAADGTVDATVRMIPGEASTFNDTDYDGLGEFQGWGTSLCWWANRLGYSEELTSEAAAKFYGKEGLMMNIGRYNVGGGDNIIGGENAEENEFLHADHIERSDSRVPGYCKNVTKMDLEEHSLEDYQDEYDRADETSGYAWNYNWEADKRQLAILQAAKETSGEEFIAEAFSNSPPYFMTNSGCSSGAEDSSKDNLRADCRKAFAAYMADVIVHWAEVGFVDFTSTTPMNEPYTNYWVKNSPKQEGCHFDQGESQSAIIEELNTELQRQLNETTNENVKRVLSNLIICGTDETDIDEAIKSYNKLSPEAKNAIQRIDTHTYSGSQRAELRALAEKEGKNLWMSEIDNGGVAGTKAGEMSCALNFAKRIITDLNGLKASAWIMWNAVDIHIDRNSTSKYDAKESIEEMKQMKYDDGKLMYDPANEKYGYWGIAIANHNTGELILTKKYYAYGQFSRYIRPGYTIMGTSDEANTLIAYDSKGKKTVIVAMNTSDSKKTWKFDLSEFKTMGSTVKAYRTSGLTEGGENWADVTASASIHADTAAKSVTAELPANSITTFIVEGTEYDTKSNYDKAEKPIQNAILSEIYAENDSVMETNQGNVEKVELNKDMVTGSPAWNNGTKDVAKNVVDGSYDTFFDGVADGWVQIDLGKEENIAGFGYAPRTGYTDRCVGASFYGSKDGQNWTKLYTISNTPSEKVLTNVYASRFDAPNNTSYRYIKYAVPVGDENAACNVSEIAVYRWKVGTNVTFKVPAVPDSLQEWVAYYKSQTEGKAYIADSWLPFYTALAEAEALLSSGNTDTAEQGSARRALAVAYQGLRAGTEADRVEMAKAVLQDGITKNTVAESEKNQYTESSWSNYQSKLTAAQNLLKAGTLTEDQAKQAVSELESAKKELESKPTVTVTVKKNQPITCAKSFAKTYGDKAFSLGAKRTVGDGVLSYVSSDKKVADYNKKTGKVEIKGTGSCIITITAEETANYKQQTATVTITVKPKKVTPGKLTPGKKSLKVSWKKDANATGYEIQCCLNKKFKSGVKKVTIKKANATSTTIKKLKKGKKYYVRIRAYKTAKVNGKSQKLIGAWSTVKTSGKVK